MSPFKARRNTYGCVHPFEGYRYGLGNKDIICLMGFDQIHVEMCTHRSTVQAHCISPNSLMFDSLYLHLYICLYMCLLIHYLNIWFNIKNEFKVSQI